MIPLQQPLQSHTAVAGSVGLQIDVDAQGGSLSTEVNLPVNETSEVLNPVQDGLNLELNSWSPGRGFAVFEQQQTTWIIADQLFVFGRVSSRSNVPLSWRSRVGLLAESSEAAVPDGGRAAAGRSAAYLRSRPAACDWGPIGGWRRTPRWNLRIIRLLPTNSATEP